MPEIREGYEAEPIECDECGDIDKTPEIIRKLQAIYPSELQDAEMNSEDRSNYSTPFMDRILEKICGYSGLGFYLKTVHGYNEEDLAAYGVEKKPAGMDENFTDILRSKLKGKIVVDLGCGIQADGYILSDVLGAAGYIGVEMNFPQAAKKRAVGLKLSTPVLIIQDDMGTFLDNFTALDMQADAIFFSGIDRYSYTGNVPLKLIIEKIHSALTENGIMLSEGNWGYQNADYGAELRSLFQDLEGKGVLSKKS